MSVIVPPCLTECEQQTAQDLTIAVETGDVAAVIAILNLWPHKPNAGMISGDHDRELWPFKLVLSGAISKRNIRLVSLALDSGMKVEVYAVMMALDIESIEVFQAFIDHGWDINMPLSETQPPLLAYENFKSLRR